MLIADRLSFRSLLDRPHRAAPAGALRLWSHGLWNDGLAQLPEGGCNVIILGHLAGDRAQLERALRGMEVAEFVRNLETKEVASEWIRPPLGACSSGEKR